MTRLAGLGGIGLLMVSGSVTVAQDRGAGEPVA